MHPWLAAGSGRCIVAKVFDTRIGLLIQRCFIRGHEIIGHHAHPFISKLNRINNLIGNQRARRIDRHNRGLSATPSDRPWAAVLAPSSAPPQVILRPSSLLLRLRISDLAILAHQRGYRDWGQIHRSFSGGRLSIVETDREGWQNHDTRQCHGRR